MTTSEAAIDPFFVDTPPVDTPQEATWAPHTFITRLRKLSGWAHYGVACAILDTTRTELQTTLAKARRTDAEPILADFAARFQLVVSSGANFVAFGVIGTEFPATYTWGGAGRQIDDPRRNVDYRGMILELATACSRAYFNSYPNEVMDLRNAYDAARSNARMLSHSEAN